MLISASEVQQRFLQLLDQVIATGEAIHISSDRGDAVLMSADVYDLWLETVTTTGSPSSEQPGE